MKGARKVVRCNETPISLTLFNVMGLPPVVIQRDLEMGRKLFDVMELPPV